MAQGLIQTEKTSGGCLPKDGSPLQLTQVTDAVYMDALHPQTCCWCSGEFLLNAERVLSEGHRHVMVCHVYLMLFCGPSEIRVKCLRFKIEREK